MSELEQSSSDVSEASSTSEGSSSLENGSQDNRNLSTERQSKPEIPFHEHPRFKELIEQKNEFANRLKDYESRFKEMQDRISSYDKQNAPKSTEQKLIERLKGIDPEFGTWAEKQEALTAELNDFRAWKQQMEMGTAQREAVSSIDKLHAENNVPAERRDLYLSLMKDIANGNPKLGANDIPAIYKQVHNYVNSLLDGHKRNVLAEYTKGKQADSKVPTPGRGATPKPQAKVELSKDPDQARAQMIKRTLDMVRAQKDY